VKLPHKDENGQCLSYARIVLHLDLDDAGLVTVQRREQFDDKDHSHKDFNYMGGYELCHGKEFTPPASASHCSVGSRMTDDGPCLTRLEQLTYDEAHDACQARGGQLAKVTTLDYANALSDFGDGQTLGIGLRDYGADDAWFFDDNTSAAEAVQILQDAIEHSNSEREEPLQANRFRKMACVALTHSSAKRRDGALSPMDCATKADWICEGTMANPSDGGLMVQGDLMADEGAFCLWHIHEPVDLLPNDEGKNFRNTDLQCHLQTSSREERECAFEPSSRRRGLVRQRGSRFNGENYPVKGSTIGWKGNKGKLNFLKLENSDDHFHCHYSPNNNGLLRVYAMQHMFDRIYPGSMRKTCGCGYKHLAQLVSRCDCTRSGKRDNNCAEWHRDQLIQATNTTHPVRCNNCNSKDKL
jgi:hypothetical protein